MENVQPAVESGLLKAVCLYVWCMQEEVKDRQKAASEDLVDGSGTAVGQGLSLTHPLHHLGAKPMFKESSLERKPQLKVWTAAARRRRFLKDEDTVLGC